MKRIVSVICALLAAALALPPMIYGQNWPDSIKADDGFAALGRAMRTDPDFPTNGSDVEKARYIYSQLPNIASKYKLKAGGGGLIDQAAVGLTRLNSDFNPFSSSDPENTDGLKYHGLGNCGEWSYAFTEVLGGADIPCRAVYGDKTASVTSPGFGGTDTTVIVDDRREDGRTSRRVFDAFRAAFHSPSKAPTNNSLSLWGDVPLSPEDKWPGEKKSVWQTELVKKPYVKDAISNEMLDPVAERFRANTAPPLDESAANKKPAEGGDEKPEAETADATSSAGGTAGPNSQAGPRPDNWPADEPWPPTPERLLALIKKPLELPTQDGDAETEQPTPTPTPVATPTPTPVAGSSQTDFENGGGEDEQESDDDNGGGEFNDGDRFSRSQEKRDAEAEGEEVDADYAEADRIEQELRDAEADLRREAARMQQMMKQKKASHELAQQQLRTYEATKRWMEKKKAKKNLAKKKKVRRPPARTVKRRPPKRRTVRRHPPQQPSQQPVQQAPVHQPGALYDPPQ